MDIGHAVIKAIVQGLTEFLPVSSSAHLIFTEEIARALGWEASSSMLEAEFYDILLHIGTLLAVIFYFRRDLTLMFMSVTGQSVSQDLVTSIAPFDPKKLPVQIAISTAVTVVFILALLKGSEGLMAAMHWNAPGVSDISEYYRAHPTWVGIHLIITGGLLFFTEHYAQTHQSEAVEKPFTTRHALWIGLFQGFAAIFRGISRSGATISGGLASGVNRLTATRYSFLISIPAFVLAAVYESMKVAKSTVPLELDWTVMGAGLITCIIVAYFCVKYFVRFVAKHSLKGFAYYCWAVGLTMAIYFALQ